MLMYYVVMIDNGVKTLHSYLFRGDDIKQSTAIVCVLMNILLTLWYDHGQEYGGNIYFHIAWAVLTGHLANKSQLQYLNP